MLTVKMETVVRRFRISRICNYLKSGAEATVKVPKPGIRADLAETVISHCNRSLTIGLVSDYSRAHVYPPHDK